MIIAINYADEKYRNAQKLNSKTARRFGADRVIEYGPDSIERSFVEKNKEIFSAERGAGYWLWKPYILLKTLENVENGDYVIYSDSGSAFVSNVSVLIELMNRDGIDILPFCIDQIEKKWSKRDAFILMNADEPWIVDSNQICGTYMVVRKSDYSVRIVSEWLRYAEDVRIISNNPNVMGKDNYPEFVENRHDQTIWSLLCKKNGIKPYRDPSEYGLNHSLFESEVIERSNYQQIFESHRKPKYRFFFQLKAANKWYERVLKKFTNNRITRFFENR